MTNTVMFKNTHLSHCAGKVRQIRKIALIARLKPHPKNIPTVEIKCAGNCGSVQRIRADRVKAGQVFVCNTKATRDICQMMIPRVVNGYVREFHNQAAGALTGVTYQERPAHVVLGSTIAGVFERSVLRLANFMTKR